MNDENTFTTTELDALAIAFNPDEGWKWQQYAIEPDARIDVLISETDDPGAPKFLVRHQHGWVWASGAKEAERKRRNQMPYTWKAMISELVGLEFLRIPTADELRAGGWEIEDTPPQDEEEETLPLATSTLLGARDLLEREDGRGPLTGEIAEATALALTSIAATMHDLSVLLEDEFAWRRSQRPDPVAVEESEENDSAHRSLGPGEDPGFSFSGR